MTVDNPVEPVDYWERRVQIDALTGGWFHDPHDLDTAQFDRLPAAPSKPLRICRIDGCANLARYKAGVCRRHWRLR